MEHSQYHFSLSFRTLGLQRPVKRRTTHVQEIGHILPGLAFVDQFPRVADSLRPFRLETNRALILTPMPGLRPTPWSAISGASTPAFGCGYAAWWRRPVACGL